MIYIHFIINPISGKGENSLSLSFLEEILPKSQFKIEIDYTQFKKHANTLTIQIIKKKPDYIIACGGDGTINEIASCIVGGNIVLGIIPFGSGNGLASNLNIPKNVKKAVELIKLGKVSTIDVGKVNNDYFFNCMGIGIDAMIIKKYDQSGIRMRKAYTIATAKSILQFKARNIRVMLSKKTISIKPYLLFISNTNEMGYKLSLTPKADLQDGYLNMVIVPELSFFTRIKLLYYIFLRKFDAFKKAQQLLIKNTIIDIPGSNDLDVQIDGEIYNPEMNRLEISVIHRGLKVITAI